MLCQDYSRLGHNLEEPKSGKAALKWACEFDEGLLFVIFDDSQPGQFGSGRRASTVANVTAGVLYCCA
jgi:hypothetical protein